MVREVLIGATAFLYLAVTTVTAPAQQEEPAIETQSEMSEPQPNLLEETGV